VVCALPVRSHVVCALPVRSHVVCALPVRSHVVCALPVEFDYVIKQFYTAIEGNEGLFRLSDVLFFIHFKFT
jgi:hypothetical protein